MYYLTSLCEEDNSNSSELFPNNYSLAICYNLRKAPSIPHHAVLDCLNFKDMCTESIVKTIIMLSSMNANNYIEKATESLNYIEKHTPKVKMNLVVELLDALSSSFTSFSRIAVSNFYFNYYNDLDEESRAKLFYLLKDYLSIINTDLHDEFRKTFAAKIESANVIIHKEFETTKKLLESHKVEINSSVFEQMALQKFIIPSVISNFLSETQTSHLSEILKSVESILLVLSVTEANTQIFEKICDTIEKHSLWFEMSLDAKINVFFISGSTSKELKFPHEFVSSFVAAIESINFQESLEKNRINGLLNYRLFKYTTELEPRYIVSDDIQVRKFTPQISMLPLVPFKEIIKYPKLQTILNRIGKKTTQEIRTNLSAFYRLRDEDEFFQELKIKVENDLKSLLEGSRWIIDHFDQNTGWRCDFFDPASNIAVILTTSSDYYPKGNSQSDLNLIQKSIIQQLTEISKYKVFEINSKVWYGLDDKLKKAFLAHH